MTTLVTKKHARKVLEVVDVGLVSGVGQPVPGQMCVEAAVCFALGEPHGDKPTCVHPVIRSFKITLNDSNWSSEKARGQGLRRIAIAQLGSTDIDAKGWLDYVVESHIREIVPIPFRIAAAKLPQFADSLNAAADRCEREGTKDAAYAAARAAYAAYAADAARAAYAAAYAADAAYAAYAAARAADAAYAAYAADKDRVLTLSAEIAVQACIKFKTQGSKWLDLVGGRNV